MDDTTRGIGDESMSGRGEESTRNYSEAAGVPVRPGPAATRGGVGPGESAASTTARDAGSAGDADADRRTREIRAEIEQTREDMSETIEAIQERLRPGNIVADAKDRVRTATTERVRQMADSASETARNVMDQTREMAGDFVGGGRQNAIPAAMIGVGVAWLLIDRFREGRQQHRTWDDRWNEQRDRSYRMGAYDSSDRYYGQGASSGMPSESGGMTDAASRVASGARGAGRAARQTGRRAQNQLQRMMRENPLMVGAAAAVIGAAVGMALPETERENEWLGEAKETVVDRAQEMARSAATAVQEAAGDVAGEVTSKVISGKSSGQ
jgi:hypothetical protein